MYSATSKISIGMQSYKCMIHFTTKSPHEQNEALNIWNQNLEKIPMCHNILFSSRPQNHLPSLIVVWQWQCFQSGKQEVLCGATSKHLSHPHWILLHESTRVTEWIPLNYLTGDVWRSGKKREKKTQTKTSQALLNCVRQIHVLLSVFSLSSCLSLLSEFKAGSDWADHLSACSQRAFQSRARKTGNKCPSFHWKI